MKKAYDIIVIKKELYDEWVIIDELGNTLEIMMVQPVNELTPSELKELASGLSY